MRDRTIRVLSSPRFPRLFLADQRKRSAAEWFLETFPLVKCNFL
jgi:hypothetical protein